MAQLTPRFSADRAVREYTEKYYLPAAEAHLERSRNKCEKAGQITERLKYMGQMWDSIQFGEVKFKTIEKQHNFEAKVHLNSSNTNIIKIELFADGINDKTPVRQEMKLNYHPDITDNGYTYNTIVSSDRPASDYTIRIIPNIPGISVPLESALIHWHH